MLAPVYQFGHVARCFSAEQPKGRFSIQGRARGSNAKGSGMGACGSKKDEETVIVYDERDRPRRVSVTEYGQINDAHQRKLNNMGYDNAGPSANPYVQRSGVRDEVRVEPIPEYVVDYRKDGAQLKEELQRDKLQQREMEERDSGTEGRLVTRGASEPSLMDQHGSPKGDSIKDGECIVCLDAPRTHLMHPCGHLSMCERCAGTLMASVLPKCAVCRKDVDSIVKVYK